MSFCLLISSDVCICVSVCACPQEIKLWLWPTQYGCWEQVFCKSSVCTLNDWAISLQPQLWYIQQLLLQRNFSFTITNLSKFYSKKLCVEIKMSIKMSIITIKHPTGQKQQGPNSVCNVLFPRWASLRRKNNKKIFPGWKARTASNWIGASTEL